VIQAKPPAFVASCAFGALGAVLLLLGLVIGSTPLLILSALMGTLSLISALVWRSQLIDAWHERQRRG
jgi:predicted aspartyl protease